MAVRRVRSGVLKSSVVDSERVSVMRKGNGCKECRVGKGLKGVEGKESESWGGLGCF